MVARGLLMHIKHQMNSICVSEIVCSVHGKGIEPVGGPYVKVNLLVLKEHHAIRIGSDRDMHPH